MRKKILYTLMSGLLLFGLASCDKDDDKFDNKLYINSRSKTGEILLKGNNESKAGFTISMPKTESNDVTFYLEIEPDNVNRYNEAYYDNAILLPETFYNFSSKEGIIAAGSVASAEVSVNFLNLTSLDTEQIYVLPVSIKSNQLGVLESARTIYYVVKEAALINVVGNIDKNKVYVDWKDASDFREMKTFTAEALVRPVSFDNMINTLMGIEGQFLLRYGDAGIPSNQLQIATSAGNYTSETLQLPTNTWTHVAMTYDADAKKVEVYYNGKNVFTATTGDIGAVDWGVEHSDESDGKPRCFWIGYSYDSNRFFNGDISEVRIWDHVLTSSEINETNHFYYVEPDSEGLIAYWKFDEGGGADIKDYSSKKNHATAPDALTWNKVELPAK